MERFWRNAQRFVRLLAQSLDDSKRGVRVEVEIRTLHPADGFAHGDPSTLFLPPPQGPWLCRWLAVRIRDMRFAGGDAR
jgi:hypothetical protein